jgi:hypothetical protein
MTSKLKVNLINDSGDNNIITSDGSGSFTASSSLASSVQSVGGIQMTPAFHAYLSSVQNISNATTTKVQINTEVFDSDSCYDNSTNYRFTPTVAGKYFVYGIITIDASSNSSLEHAYAFLYKNGALISQTEGTFSDNKIRRISQLTYQVVDMNGTTDYLELFGRQDGGTSPAFEGGNTNKDSVFGAYRIIGA